MSSSSAPNDPMYQDQPRRQSQPPSYRPPAPGEPYYQQGDEMTQAADYGGAHEERRYASYDDGAGNVIERRQQVYHDTNRQRANIRYAATTLIYFLLGVLEVIMGLRWLFRLLGANTDNSFISFLYSLSHIFVAPFNNIFNDQSLGRQGVFEFSTLIAMLIYALIAWGLVTLVNLIFRPTAGGTDSIFSTRHRQY